MEEVRVTRATEKGLCVLLNKRKHGGRICAWLHAFYHGLMSFQRSRDVYSRSQARARLQRPAAGRSGASRLPSFWMSFTWAEACLKRLVSVLNAGLRARCSG